MGQRKRRWRRRRRRRRRRWRWRRWCCLAYGFFDLQRRNYKQILMQNKNYLFWTFYFYLSIRNVVIIIIIVVVDPFITNPIGSHREDKHAY